MPIVTDQARYVSRGDFIRVSTRTPMPIHGRWVQVAQMYNATVTDDRETGLNVQILLKGNGWALLCNPDRQLEVYRRPAPDAKRRRRFRKR